MIEIHSKKINKQELMRNLEAIHQEAKANPAPREVYKEQKQDIQKTADTAEKTNFTVDDFLSYNDTEFLQVVYKKVLKRAIDTPSLNLHLALLRSGEKTKTQLLSSIRYSAEGRSKNVEIQGLKKHYILSAIYKLPLLGYLFKTSMILFRLPKQFQRLHSIEANYHLYQALTNKRVQDLEQAILDMKEEAKAKAKEEKEKQDKHDIFYLAFENQFRGTREDIKTRQSYYLSMVKDVMNAPNDKLLDIGSGRGEWLELLKESHLEAFGVDLNKKMVEVAQSYHLNVTHKDALVLLRASEEESLSVISGFHIVEHISFTLLLELFKETLRVLKRGGMIIFETPNPQNLLVGSCSFYTDPTHINPIPAESLQFMANYSGFKDVSIHKLTKRKEALFLEGANTEQVNELIQLASMEQDYAIVGYKR